LTGEDWNEVMFNGIESRGGVKNWGLVYSLYFIILVVFGNCILCSLLLKLSSVNLFSPHGTAMPEGLYFTAVVFSFFFLLTFFLLLSFSTPNLWSH